jgi:hypothetical protein
MVAILQPSRGIAPDRLDVRARVGGVEHVLVGRRHGEALQSRACPRVADGAPARRDEAVAVAVALAADRQRIGRDVAQAEPPQGDRGEPRFQLAGGAIGLFRGV